VTVNATNGDDVLSVLGFGTAAAVAGLQALVNITASEGANDALVVNGGGGSFKSQMKRADASGARYAIILGDDEVAANRVGVKPLRVTGEQIALAPADVAARLRTAH